MSHHLLPKRFWIMIIAAACTFLGMAYGWLYYTDQSITKIDLYVQEQISEQTLQEQKNEIYQVEEAAQYTEEPLDESVIENTVIFPCILQMKQDKIGLYTKQSRLIKELKPMGELLSKNDMKILQQGIPIENEIELIMVLESYHLQ